MNTTLIVAILSPLLLTIGGLITWFFKSKKEEVLLAEEKTREFKIKTYETLLEPFIITFTFTLKENQKQKGIQKLHSLDYRKAAFNLTTFGSDDVVKSYNKLMQAFFNVRIEDYDEDDEGYAVLMLTLISDLLLNIRKDLYTDRTNLKRSELLEFMISDIEKQRTKIDNWSI